MFQTNPEHLFLLQKRKEGKPNCRFSASVMDCCIAGLCKTKGGGALTSPKAPRPITFRISKSSLCRRICFTLEVNGLAAGRRRRWIKTSEDRRNHHHPEGYWAPPPTTTLYPPTARRRSIDQILCLKPIKSAPDDRCFLDNTVQDQ